MVRFGISSMGGSCGRGQRDVLGARYGCRRQGRRSDLEAKVAARTEESQELYLQAEHRAEQIAGR